MKPLINAVKARLINRRVYYIVAGISFTGILLIELAPAVGLGLFIVSAPLAIYIASELGRKEGKQWWADQKLENNHTKHSGT